MMIELSAGAEAELLRRRLVTQADLDDPEQSPFALGDVLDRILGID